MMIPRQRSKGYSSIFLVIILSSCVIAALAFIEICTRNSSRAIANDLCSISCRSVLSEYHKELFDSYGILAVKNSESFISDRFRFYVDKSLPGKGFVTHFRIGDISADSSGHSFENSNELIRQISMMGYSLDAYITEFFSNELNPREGSLSAYEAEYIIYGLGSDKANRMAFKAELYVVRLAINFARLETEAYKPDASGQIPRYTVYRELSDAEMADILMGRAIALANEDVRMLYAGESVPYFDEENEDSYGNYEDYVRMFLSVMGLRGKLTRMKKIIENNINQVQGKAFSFDSYCYGFDIDVCFEKKRISSMLGFESPSFEINESASYK